MVCLNNNIPMDYSKMKKVILLELDNIIKNELYYIDEINENKKDRIKDNIIKEMKNQFNSDLFIKRMMNDNHCIFKHKTGKNDGKICCKRITKNGDKSNYVCTTHNKDHIPKKKIKINDNDGNIKNDKSIELIINNKIDNKTNISIKNSIENIDIENTTRNTKNMVHEISTDIKNTKINSFKTSFNLYNNIICKYKNNSICYNIIKYGHCDFKHMDNKIHITKFLYNNYNDQIESY